jgi:hypothetical protein
LFEQGLWQLEAFLNSNWLVARFELTTSCAASLASSAKPIRRLKPRLPTSAAPELVLPFHSSKMRLGMVCQKARCEFSDPIIRFGLNFLFE